MENKIKNIIPYLNFEGNCEEALYFYQSIFGGKVEIQSRYDNPAMNLPTGQAGTPENYKNKVLHGRLYFSDLAIYASDIFPGKKANKNSGDVQLSLDVTDPETGKKIFGLLADGGKIGLGFEKQFWGQWHGNLIDKYGIRWMVNC